MRRLVVIFLFTMPLSALAQKQGVGLRIGNPLGLSYKRYITDAKAFEVSIGTVSDGWNEDYYKNAFSGFDKYESYTYHSHDVQSSVYFQGRHLFHYDITANRATGKFDWYWGIGALFKFARVNYFYFYPWELGPGGSSVLLEENRRPDIDFGPEGITGIEYTLDQAPLTFFGEVSGFLEIADQPVNFRAFAAGGMRYNF